MKIIIGILALTLAGCGQVNRVTAGVTGSSESCIDGVKYIQFPSGVTVKYTRDGKVVTC